MNHSELLSLSRDLLDRSYNLKKQDISLLREVIREHNRLYYQDEAPIISDTEYDELFHALARAESDYDMLDADSPTARLAILASGQFKKVQHIYPMISLDNTYSVEEIREWNERMMRILHLTPNPSPQGEGNDRWSDPKRDLNSWKSFTSHSHSEKRMSDELRYYVQPKYDGLGLAVIYRYGKLDQAVTRGSGVEWEDVTLGAYEIKNIPKTIDALGSIERMEIRGEVMMSRTTFSRVNHERLAAWEKLFANPRNAASGSLRQLDPLVTRSRELQFFAYSIPQIEASPQPSPEGEGVETYWAMMGLLTSWGFEREDFPFTLIHGLDDLLHLIENETDNRQEYFDFDIDGMVIKLDDMTLWTYLGRTEHHPRYAIAYKFPAKQVRTRVISIEHSVGRTGTVTPVANLEPIDVSGVIVRRATLHNYDELEKKWVREGDYVFVMRAGEVIPEIVSVITGLRTGSEQIVHIPKNCPVCMTPLEQDAWKVAIYCPNPHCSAKIQWQLEMFVGKQGMNIDGLGVKQIELFLELGWITDFASVFDLGRYAHEMLELEGYKEKSIQNLKNALEASRHTTLDRVFTAIGIPNVWKKTAKLIAKKITEHLVPHSLLCRRREEIPEIHSHDSPSHGMLGEQSSLLSCIFHITEEELLEVKDIGPETARAFVDYMRDNKALVERLFARLDIEVPEQILTPLMCRTDSVGCSHSGVWLPLVAHRSSEWQKPWEHTDSEIAWKSFCVTGSFDTLSRDEIHELIEKNGGEVRSAVSSKLDYLIVWENAGSKKIKAEELRIRIISLDDFLSMIA